MGETQKVLLYHLLTVDGPFLDELHSRVIINRKQTQKLKTLDGPSLLDSLIDMLQRSTKIDLNAAFLECLDVTHQGFVKPHIGDLLSTQRLGEEQRYLLLKVQKLRNSIKDQLKDPMTLVHDKELRKFLKPDQVKSIQAKSEEVSKTNALINCVIRNGYEVLQAFLSTLREHGYESLATEIEELEVDEAGQIIDMAKIVMTLRLKEHRINQDPILLDMAKDLDPVCKRFFEVDSPLSKKYHVVYNSHAKGPYTLILNKLPGYSRRVFCQDLLNKDIAAVMDDEISRSEFIRRTKKKVNIVLDVNLRQLKDVKALQDQRDGSPSSLDSMNEEAESEEEDDEDNDACGCDGDGSCVADLLENYNASQANSQRTEIVHKAAVEMVKKHVLIRGEKHFTHTPHEIYLLLVKNMATMSFDLVKRHAPVTILHVSAFEGRTDVMQVLFECGMLREFKDVPVRDERSNYKSKTVEQILEIPLFSRSKEKFNNLVALDASSTWLHRCAQIGHLECVQRLLERHHHLVNKEAKDKSTPLYWAVTSGNLAVFKALHDLGGSLTCSVGNGETLLTRAVSYCQYDIAKYLVEVCHVSLEERGVDQCLPKELAVKRLDVAMLDMLLKKEANVDPSLTVTVGRDGNMALMQVLQRRGCMNLNVQAPNGRTPLLMAVEKGNLPLVKMMIENGADMDVSDKQNRNIIHKAAESKNTEMLLYICDKMKERARLDQRLNQQDRYLGQERCFVVRGRDNGVAAFHYVEVERRYMNVFRQITRDGGTVDVARYGNTLRSGWGANPTELVVTEMDQRYNLATIPPTATADLTPLNLAILREFPEGAEMLAMKYNADVNIADSFGLTPLHMASMRGNFELVRDLVERKGAKIDVEDSNKQTSAMTADTNRHFDIYNYLEGDTSIKSPKLEQFRKKLQETEQLLSLDDLGVVRQQGQDVKRKVVEVVRSIQDDINNLLYEFGSAAIQEESTRMEQVEQTD